MIVIFATLPHDQKKTSPDCIEYRYLHGLGGLRHPHKDTQNAGWRNQSFRGYADYMQTEEFAANVDTVIELSRTKSCALMCAEAASMA
ncbi:MAG: DUF488 domain-containing protein [Pseudomonadota bacterium]